VPELILMSLIVIYVFARWFRGPSEDRKLRR